MIEEQKKNKIEMVQNIFLGLLGLGLIIKIFIPVFEYVMDIAAVGLVTTLLYKATLEKHTGKAFLYSLLLLLIFILIFTQRMN
ncbi:MULTISPECIES: hypothetical protein [Staphylococcaceae]|uniref:AI-2E family transporter n=1 Tax=Macrococcus psychrotolerans TaxID=3039389 RepID=A0AAT9P237_9STAP|nr:MULTISPECIES: hypothetical protein [Macrococcus]PKF20347.1 hypothetical protein CW684_11310 [Macrococcus caseolyticus]PKF32282.1 hypothetical protein CW687_11410 [Macrococcus caseolyticus]QYA32360.1 hypothetical protein KYI10_08190 [Macrococcus sp. 19Msa1099]QYA37167.1 hypothetical protein KYI07_08180 [Macrococcus caseolyticus]QYA75875.1 hypothetical protein KYI12_08180 [Macrococcus caseolyticus]